MGEQVAEQIEDIEMALPVEARVLQDRVHRLLYQSLEPLGDLGLGRTETIEFTPHAASYEGVPGGERIYRKIR